MTVPLLDVSRQHAPLRDACLAAMTAVFDSGRFILGEAVEQFERELAAYCGTAQAISISSGSDALLVALMALDMGPGDEVLCPAFTFFATAGAIARLGAVPVWVDSVEGTFNMDVEDARRKVSPKTRAMIPVHLFGQACPMDAVLELAREHSLRVLEDAAQAIGARFGGKAVGGFGDLAALSFYPTKNLGGFGDGGAVLTNDAALAERVKRLRNHGMHPRYVHHEVGGNFRLDALQTELLRIKLPKLDGYHQRRRENAAFYFEHLAGIEGLGLPEVLPECDSVWNQFTVRVAGARRDALKAHLASAGVGSEIYYPITLDQQSCFDGVGRGGDALPVAHGLADSVLSLPIFPELTLDELEEVVAAVKSFFAE